MRAAWVLPLFALVLLAACQDQPVVATTRNLLRPGPMGLACIARAESGKFTALAPAQCDGKERAGEVRRLFGVVANTARSDVALFRTFGKGEPLVDLDPSSPGFGFIPVGVLPTDLKTTPNSCRAVVANSGSCDLSIIDLPAAMQVGAGALGRSAGGVVSRITPFTSEGPLLARPRELVIIPDSAPSGSGKCASARYRAYVSFPTCGLVAEIDLSSGRVLDGAVITSDGVRFTKTPRCEAECKLRSGLHLPDGSAALGDGGRGVRDARSGTDGNADARATKDVGATPDAPASVEGGVPPADAGVEAGAVPSDGGDGGGLAAEQASDGGGGGDGGGGDGGTTKVSTAGVLPYSLALSDKGDRLYVSSAGAGFITVLEIDRDGFSGSHRIRLAGDRAFTVRLKLSPKTSKLGQFLYAIATDQTVRVISTSLNPEKECETNLDLQKLPSTVPIDRAACFVVGGDNTPDRRVTAKGPGLNFGKRVPSEVTFVTAQGKKASSGTDITGDAVPLEGVYALIALTDGNIFVVDIQDATAISSGTKAVSRLRLPHRVRNVARGTDSGDASTKIDSISGAKKGGVPVVVRRFNGATRGVTLRAIGEVVDEKLPVIYEPRLLSRTAGQLTIRNGELFLSDPGGVFCRSGVLGRSEQDGRPVRHGDIVGFVGCEDDSDCAPGQLCRRVVGQQTQFGLCFDKGREDQLFQQCSAFLRGAREFLVRRATRDRLYLDVLPLEPQGVIKQRNQPSGGCKKNGDCADGFLCALDDAPVRGKPALSLREGECFRSGCKSNKDCPTGQCVQPLDGSGKVCAPVPLPLEIGPRCKQDADCRPSRTGGSCDSASDCDRRAICKSVKSGSKDKQCVTRGWVCSEFSGLKGRCVAPSPCFADLQSYQVFAGRTFLAGRYRRVIADAKTHECVHDSSRSPLLAQRIPIGLPIYPVVAGPSCKSSPARGGVPSPNPCFERSNKTYDGPTLVGGTDRIESASAPTTVVHFANPDISFSLGVSHLLSGRTMPARGLRIDIEVKSGYVRLAVPGAGSGLSVPVTMVPGPDGMVYIVDMGERSGNTQTRGQVVRMERDSLQLQNFLVK